MNIKMQFCGIILMLVILYFYVCRKKIKLMTAQAFMRIFWVTFFSLILDVGSLVLLYYHDVVPEFLIDLECKTYLSSLVLVGRGAFLYICTDIYGEGAQYRKKKLRCFLIAGVGILAIFVAPLYKSWDDPEQIYTYGPSVLITYGFALFFLLRVLVLLIAQKKEMNSRRWDAMRIWMLLWFGAAGTQFIFNELLLVGFGSAVGVMIIYLKLENPELNIDKGTGLFNQEGMMLYVDQLCKSKKPFAAISIVMPDALAVETAQGEQRIARAEVLSYLHSVQQAYVFRNRENEAVLIWEKRAIADMYREILKCRFEAGWGKDGATYLKPRWIYMPDGSMVTDSADVVHLLDYVRTRGVSDIENDIVLIDEKMLHDMYEEKHVETLIMEALDQDRVEVFYQPIYSTKEKCFCSAEALVRIRDGEGELVPPGIFIDVAEKNGSIIKLGEIVFEKVCRFLRDQQPQQYGLKYIEVNLSVVQCSYEQLAERYISVMKKYRISPEWINLEITESASVEEKKVLLDNMKKLINYGVSFSLDDFGTGQSNLNYIVEMPLDIVKFDRGMTASYFENGKAKYVMDAAMRMIQGMKLQIVSEGVETAEQFETMNGLGISYIQGYYFSKPLPEQEFLDFIRQNYRKMEAPSASADKSGFLAASM